MGHTHAAAGAHNHTGLRAAWHGVAVRWQRALQQRRRIAQHMRELNGYTDRELGELGLDRFDIPAVARGTYRRG